MSREMDVDRLFARLVLKSPITVKTEAWEARELSEAERIELAERCFGGKKLLVNDDGTVAEREAREIEHITGLEVDRKHNVLMDHRVKLRRR